MSDLQATALPPRRGFRGMEALAPLAASYGFRVLLTAQLIGILGRWMQSLAAQWSLVDESPAMVALVPTAMSIPIVLFALVAGAWADQVDRRRMLILTQGSLAVTATALATLSFAGLASPWVVLGLMFVMGTWTAANIPPFQSGISEVVPREHIVQAATLTAVGANVGRAIGPAVAGGVVIAAGLGGGFALAAVAYFVAWAYTLRVGALGHQVKSTERLGEALRAGNQYIRHSGSTLLILFWTIIFVALNAALWALLPAVANGRLHLEALGYGLLLGAVGAGALLGALVMPVATRRWSQNELFAISLVVTALATIGATVVGNAWLVGALLVPLGSAYIVVIAITNGTLQLTLPSWVRARGLAMYVVTFHIAMGAGSALWGLAANAIGANASVAISGIGLLAATPLLLWIRVPETSLADNVDAVAWAEPDLALDVAGDDSPVTVTTVYRVSPENRAEFMRTMAALGKARRRAGASRHEVLQEGSSPETFLERYVVPSWTGYVRLQAERLTPADRELERQAHELCDEVGTERHWFTPRPPGADGTDRAKSDG